jgi:hypothetical protein
MERFVCHLYSTEEPQYQSLFGYDNVKYNLALVLVLASAIVLKIVQLVLLAPLTV